MANGRCSDSGEGEGDGGDGIFIDIGSLGTQ